MYVGFFFKQKTAYEMRISDWSSDVCSSDLLFAPLSESHRPDSDRLCPKAARRQGTRAFTIRFAAYRQYRPGCRLFRPWRLPQDLRPDCRSEERRVGKECQYV